MKTILNIILGSVLLVVFSQCGNSKTTVSQSKTPFTIKKATYGYVNKSLITRVVIEIKNLKSIEIESVSFRGLQKKAELIILKNNTTEVSARFIVRPKLDIVMYSDPKKEFGNKAPVMNAKTPIKLTDDEAAISYIEAGILKYYKIKLEKRK